MRRPALLAAVLVLWAAAAAGAQEPDTVPAAPERPERAGQVASPAQEAGQDTTAQDTIVVAPVEPPRYAFSLTLATLGFGTFQSQTVLAERQNALGEPLDTAFLRRAVEPDGGFQVLGSALVTFGTDWAARVGAAVGRTTLRTSYTGADTTWVITAATLAREEATPATIISVEAALRRWIPSTRAIQPFVELGAAALRMDADQPLAGAPETGSGVTRLAALAAAGGYLPLTEHLRVRVQATARAFRTPVEAAAAGTAGASSSTLRTTFVSPASTRFADEAEELTTSIRLEIGLTLGVPPPDGPPR